MTQPNPQDLIPNTLSGWNYLGQVLQKWIPARLRIMHTATRGMNTRKVGR